MGESVTKINDDFRNEYIEALSEQKTKTATPTGQKGKFNHNILYQAITNVLTKNGYDIHHSGVQEALASFLQNLHSLSL